MWVDVPQIPLLSLFFGRKSRASTKKFCQVPKPVGKFSGGFSLDYDPLNESRWDTSCRSTCTSWIKVGGPSVDFFLSL